MEINQAWIDEFFREMTDDLILKIRETGVLEFKATFDWDNKEFKSNIAKSAAAFANRDGGLIVFGVENKPHLLVGVDGFDKVDDANISVYFNEIFSPSILFTRYIFNVKDMLVGIIQIFE